jgi:death-on-curing protein
MVGAIHFDQIQQHGGDRGVLDEGMLQSALARPKNKWGYEPESDLAVLAAAYGFAFAKNHGFIDGNKRVAFLVMFVFLGLNGYEIEAPEEEVVATIRDVAANVRDEAALADWLRGRLIRIPA